MTRDGLSDRVVPAWGRARTIVLVTLALTGLAANSLLTRLALVPGDLDAAGFTAIRLAGGAVGLALVVAVRARRRQRSGDGGEARPDDPAGPGPVPWRDRWVPALLLAAYAVPFTYAFGRIEAGVGVLVVFGFVQLTMIGVGLRRGERPPVVAWIGLTVALAGLALLALPGAARPDPIGVLLTALAGIAWGGYSLVGRTAGDPLVATAGNFARATPVAVAALAPALGALARATPRGLALAAASGVVASGLAYVAWYAALPRLTAVRGALVQLLVPVLVALAAVPLLGEPITARVVAAGAAVLGGVTLALVARQRG
jgi:drug/metabolite transporter (DMT)-like permease